MTLCRTTFNRMILGRTMFRRIILGRRTIFRRVTLSEELDLVEQH